MNFEKRSNEKKEDNIKTAKSLISVANIMNSDKSRKNSEN